MRLLIDYQGAQSESRYRGIGRYSSSLVKALLAQTTDEDHIELLLNMRLPTFIQSIHSELAQHLNVGQFRLLEVAGPVREIVADNSALARVSEIAREAAIAALAPDVNLVTSLFEGFVDDAVTSIASYTKTVPTAVVLYDLIPLLRPGEYLNGAEARAWYERKLGSLKKSDLLLAISGHTRNEAIDALQLPGDRVVEIGAGLDAGFQPRTLSEQARARLLQRYRINRKFVMYTGGFDPRKNLERLIEAFALLAPNLKSSYQLAIVGRISEHDMQRLAELARRAGLADDSVVFTGYAAENDLAALYCSCELFVFPSMHEGFGLPALEAMACGAPTIGADAGSIPEVIGRRDALFDPKRVDMIADKLTQGLTDADFRQALAERGRARAARFTWEATAAKALAALHELSDARRPTSRHRSTHRPRLAFVSPLPPCKTGIADYSEILLDCLEPHYEIELIDAQNEPITGRLTTRFPLRTAAWFRSYSKSFDRVLYQFGNSPFHLEIFTLAAHIPGVAVVHDFFMSDVLRWLQVSASEPGAFSRAVYESHGLSGVLAKLRRGDDEAVRTLPANFTTLSLASHLLVHSQHSIDLAVKWYGESIRRRFTQIPFPRPLRTVASCVQVRERLGVPANGFVVSSFGMVAPTKQSRELLQAWLASRCATEPANRLVFVGENEGADYGKLLVEDIERSGRSDQILITGFVDSSVYQDYLAATDIAVQLRSSSRGETSAAAFDVMSAGRALIANQHGSMSELPAEAVHLLPDQCKASDLVEALNSLYARPVEAKALGLAAAAHVERDHSVNAVGAAFFEALEGAYAAPDFAVSHTLRQAFAGIRELYDISDLDRLALSHASIMSIAPDRQRVMFIDVTSIAQSERHTGIERCVRAIVLEWLHRQPLGYRVELVRHDRSAGSYRYALDFGRRLLETDEQFGTDELIEVWPGDVFLGLDFAADRIPEMESWFIAQRNRGLSVYFVIYDLLPINLPQFFPTWLPEIVDRWLHCVGRISDGLLCISNAGREELITWLDRTAPRRENPLRLGTFQLGADVESTAATSGLPANYAQITAALQRRPTFLMVGTVEPRKGHAQVLEAFGRLWTQGVDVGLLIAGRLGWMMDAFAAAVDSHPESGERLLWVRDSSDEFIDHAYKGCAALIAASAGEGFGLPLIEAARHRLPIIAHDIAVFREVAGGGAFYFADTDPSTIGFAVEQWLELRNRDAVPDSQTIVWTTWEKSAQQLAGLIKGTEPITNWHSDLHLRPGTRIRFDSDQLQWQGWSIPEATHRWSSGTRAALVFSLSSNFRWAGQLVFHLRTLGRQRIGLRLNDHTLGDWIKDTSGDSWPLQMPLDALHFETDNRLEFSLPDARAPGKQDPRQLAIAMHSIEFI